MSQLSLHAYPSPIPVTCTILLSATNANSGRPLRGATLHLIPRGGAAAHTLTVPSLLSLQPPPPFLSRSLRLPSIHNPPDGPGISFSDTLTHHRFRRCYFNKWNPELGQCITEMEFMERLDLFHRGLGRSISKVCQVYADCRYPSLSLPGLVNFRPLIDCFVS